VLGVWDIEFGFVHVSPRLHGEEFSSQKSEADALPDTGAEDIRLHPIFNEYIDS
jgi:hypothetical protein